jgi:hypothetical protein
MAKVTCSKDGLLSAVFIAILVCAGSGPAFAQPADFNAAIDALRERSAPRADQASANATDLPADGTSQQNLIYPATLVPRPDLLSRLQALFAAYLDVQVDLTPLVAKLVRESAVVALPGQGQILYNPAHMLILHLPEGWETGNDIRVATLEDLGKILKHESPANPLLAAYGKGFEEFALLSKLMKDADARETLEVIWATSPRSENDKEVMRYLLLRPSEQSAEIRHETSACRQTIDQFVDDVRAGKRAAIPPIRGLTDIVKPTRFVRHENQIILVLSDGLIARYYVIAQFDVRSDRCTVALERPIFAMQSMMKQ